jgi:abortive infection bacteriophage resistance protein
LKKITTPPKPHRNYSELVSLLEKRGMIIPDKKRAERKLSQIGYYRLSGF